ncbi:ABC transporter ATP-binding protein [Alteromonas aestuariivivens]|uniref:ABC transporter ATP-binding protein n=1 Tax=Alteromonas aestuariivivens TaxID=1938339 RepID=A0A3D8MAF9_9ALTE|nr:ABC transporter ATP-binding protein [Alteromonas aestuariivivens]RDV26804.1 ABC transporter ATP-binding protein [Alteromonas aestuariivivens]
MPDSVSEYTSPITQKAEGHELPHSAIELSDVSFQYPADSSTVVDVPCWRVAKGQQLFIDGPSGTGKSTLLNLIAGTLQPSSGTIRILGQEFSSLSSARRDRIRARHIGVVFQQFNLIPYLSVSKNIEAAAHFAGKLDSSVKPHILELFEQLRLPSKLQNQRADTLSVGQQQRVAIARAMINRPEILIVDEPTSALDAAAKDTFMQLLLSSARDCTLVFVSHDIALAEYFSHRSSIQSINRASEGLM